MNHIYQHPTTNKPPSSQNSRTRNNLQAQLVQNDPSNQSQYSQNHSDNQQGKISLRNNNTKKLYKQNTETGEEDETLTGLKDSKELEPKTKTQTLIERKGKGQQRNGNNTKGQQIKNNRQKQFTPINRTTHSFNQNISSTLSSMGNTSSIITSYDHKSRTPSANNNNNPTHKQKIDSSNSMSNSPSSIISNQCNNEALNGKKNPSIMIEEWSQKRQQHEVQQYFEKGSTKSINMTGEDLSGFEQQSGKDSSFSSFYETNERNRGQNNKKCFAMNKQQSSTAHYRQVNSEYHQQHKVGNQNHSNIPKVTNSTIPNTPYSNTQPTSMMASIRQQYQYLSPLAPNSYNNNMRSNLSTNNIINISNNNNNNHTSTQFYVSTLQSPQQASPHKNASQDFSKPVYQKQPIERQLLINKSSQQQHSHNQVNNNISYIISQPVTTRIQSAKGIPASILSVGYGSNNSKQAFISHRPYEQFNAKSSLTVRNLQYGSNNQPGERTKSHTKNYSTSELLSHNLYNSQHQQQQQLKQTNQLPKFSVNHNNLALNQQLTLMTQSQQLFSEFPSSLSSPNNRNSYNIYQNVIQTNMQTNSMNKSSDKTYILDAIQEKDEFGKLFVRCNNSNNKNGQKAQSAQSIKHLQRQKQQQARFNTRNYKIHLVNNDNPMVKSVEQNYSSNQSANDHIMNTNMSQSHQDKNHNTVPGFSNLKYIRSPTNNTQEKLQLIDKDSKNYEKYLKVGYEPFVSGNVAVNQLITQQRQRKKSADNKNHTINNSNNANNQDRINVTKEDNKQDTHSVNNSFKQNLKSQTHSIYGYNSKTVTDKGYQTGINQLQQPTMKGKNQRNYPIEIYSSDKNFHQYFRHEENHQDDVFRKTIDASMNPPNVGLAKYNRQQGKPLQSIGAHQPRPQFHYQYQLFQTNNSPNIRVNNPTNIRFQSPDYHHQQQQPQEHKNNKKLILQNLASPQYSPNKQTVFSPTQKNLQAAQKSHFLSQPESEQNRQNHVRQKKSIKKMLVSQSKGLHQKTEVFYNYNFKDLLKGEKQQARPNSRTILQAITKNQLTKIFCSTFKIGENENGCDCIPKCYWVDNWLEKIHKHPGLRKDSLMKNLDKQSHMLNYTTDNIWKNFTNEQVVSFTDVTQNNMNLSKQQIATFKQIDKDIPRTFSSHATFKGQRYREFLRQVLIHFYYLDPQLGYVQGMNIIAAGIVYHSKSVLEALQVIDFVMNVLGYKRIYLNDMKKCQELAGKTVQLVKHYCYDMYNYVTVENQVDLEMFILGWYFSMLGTFVPLEAMHFVINRFIDKQFEGLVKIIVTYFIFIKDILMEKTDSNQIMEELSVQCMVDRSQHIDWNELITVSDKLQITFREIQVLID